MPRFERADDRRFWEITLDGKTVQSRAGFLGSEGRPSNKATFPSLKAAQAEIAERIAEQKGKGYVQRPTSKEPVDEALAEAIAANPSDPGGYLVYADWLQAKKHPRGELVVLQSALADQPGDKKLTRAIDALLKKHPQLLPERFSEAAVKPRKKHPDHAVSQVTWARGFIAAARVARYFPEPPYTIRELVVELLEHPAGRFIRDLSLGVSLNEDGVASYAGVLDELARLRPKTLRRLSVVEAPPDAAELSFSELGSLLSVMQALPQLESLHLAGRSLSFGAVTMPALKLLSVATPDANGLATLRAVGLPMLEALTFDCGGVALDEKLLGSLALPKLKTLALLRTTGTDGVLQALLASPLLPQLTTLMLANGRLTNAKALHDPRLAHLTLLDVSGNELTAVPADLPKFVRAEGQRGTSQAALNAVDIAALAPNAATLAKAKALAKPKDWPRTGRAGDVFWGQCQGSELYDVTLRTAPVKATCTCFANAYNSACKHAVGLALLVSQGHPFPAKSAPFDLED